MLQWFCVRTNPQCEGRVRAGLREQGFDVYLPETTVWRRTKCAKRERINRPLLTGYLFVGIRPDSPGLYEVRQQDGVRGFVCNADGVPADFTEAPVLDAAGQPVKDGQGRLLTFRPVYELQARQAAGEFDQTPARRSPFRRGGKARILTGPFKGHIGEMLEADDEGRIKMMLEGIFKGGIVVDDDHLEPVKAAA